MGILIIYIYIYIYICMGFFIYEFSVIFGFCLIWALGGYNIEQKTSGSLAKILPARQTQFGGFFGQPFETKTFSKNTSNTSVMSMRILDNFWFLNGLTITPLWENIKGIREGIYSNFINTTEAAAEGRRSLCCPCRYNIFLFRFLIYSPLVGVNLNGV